MEQQNDVFDEISNNYHQILNKSISVSGENTTFFAENRIKRTIDKLNRLGLNRNIQTILDFGCGTGDTIPIIDAVFKPMRIIGVDRSIESIELAKKNHKNINFYFLQPEALNIPCEVHLTYCNGVFHHILGEDRGDALQQIRRSLANNGLFAFWENNPWNPGTRYIMKKCPFDKDAQMLSFIQSKIMLQNNGFEIVNISFYFFFPKRLKFLRFMEKYLLKIPFGAQYLVLARKI